jgi:hypothetical protein
MFALSFFPADENIRPAGKVIFMGRKWFPEASISRLA